jgi:hypothetical protein
MLDLKIGPNAMREQRVRERAYEIYQSPLWNHISSSALQDWLEAERQIRNEVQGSQDLHHFTAR